MKYLKPQPVKSAENLVERVDRMLKPSPRAQFEDHQFSFDLNYSTARNSLLHTPSQDIREFLDFTTDAMPEGDVYLFGGMLRDLALLGRRGFNSDIDLVVEGDWSNLASYLETLNAKKNKFGGYRLVLGEWPVDIWNARETWAIKQGFVFYEGVSSLVNTTVLNWDAILMNWRTKQLIYRENYFEQLRARVLDIVLEENPNPLGMAVRVFRHLCAKDARKITVPAAIYLAKCTKKYSFNQLKIAERESYSNSVIEKEAYLLFKHVNKPSEINISRQYEIASEIVEEKLQLKGSK